METSLRVCSGYSPAGVGLCPDRRPPVPKLDSHPFLVPKSPFGRDERGSWYNAAPPGSALTLPQVAWARL